MPRRHLPPWTKIRMARLTRRKCARNLIVVKVVVKDSADRVKAAKAVGLISVVPAKGAKADAVKVGLVQEDVKTHADEVKADPVLATVKTRADPAKAIGINLALNGVTLRAC